MTPPPFATICILTYGDYTPYFSRCLESVLATTPADRYELRLGFNAAEASFRYARDRLTTDPAAVREDRASDTLTQFQFRAPAGQSVAAWASAENLFKEPMARLMFHDLPLATEYVVWFDDDSYVRPGWWEAIEPLFHDRIDYIGQPWWVDYLPGQTEMLQAQKWYRHVPFDTREGRPGIWFMTGGFVAIRSECLREANYPDTTAVWKGDTLKQYGGDTLLGEIARQLGWRRATHWDQVMVNVDLEDRHPAPRRGGGGRQFGSEIDIAII